MIPERPRCYGTDLFLGAPLELEQLRRALAAVLPVQAESLHLEEAGSFPWAEMGQRNLVRLHRLPEAGTLAWKADLEFVEPVPVGRIQALADALGVVVALARDTAFPDEAGAMAGEGYVLFRPGVPPAAGAVHGEETVPSGDQIYGWNITDEILRPLL